jgi:hypothetical protein
MRVMLRPRSSASSQRPSRAAQSRGNAGKPVGNMVSVMQDIIKVDGVQGLFRGRAQGS